MSLSAHLQIKAQPWLAMGIILFGLGGLSLVVSVLAARQATGRTSWPLALLTLFVVAWASVEAAGLWRQRHLNLRDWRITAEGHLVLPAHEELYRLAAGSLIWPGLMILRLQPLDVPGPILYRVVLRTGQSDKTERKLARLLLWS